MSKKKLKKIVKKLSKIKAKKSEMSAEEKALKEDVLEIMEEMGVNRVDLGEQVISKKHGQPSFKPTVAGVKVSDCKQNLLDEVMNEGLTQFFSIKLDGRLVYDSVQKEHPAVLELLRKHNLKMQVNETIEIK